MVHNNLYNFWNDGNNEIELYDKLIYAVDDDDIYMNGLLGTIFGHNSVITDE